MVVTAMLYMDGFEGRRDQFLTLAGRQTPVAWKLQKNGHAEGNEREVSRQ